MRQPHDHHVPRAPSPVGRSERPLRTARRTGEGTGATCTATAGPSPCTSLREVGRGRGRIRQPRRVVVALAPSRGAARSGAVVCRRGRPTATAPLPPAPSPFGMRGRTQPFATVRNASLAKLFASPLPTGGGADPAKRVRAGEAPLVSVVVAPAPRGGRREAALSFVVVNGRRQRLLSPRPPLPSG